MEIEYTELIGEKEDTEVAILTLVPNSNFEVVAMEKVMKHAENITREERQRSGVIYDSEFVYYLKYKLKEAR